MSSIPVNAEFNRDMNSEDPSSIIKCAILCSWSHTIGPQVIHKWSPEGGVQGPLESKEFEQLVARVLHPDALTWDDGYYNPRCKILVQSSKSNVAHARVLKDIRSDCPLALLVVYSSNHMAMIWSLVNTIEVGLASTVFALSKCKTKIQDSLVLCKAMTQLNEALNRVAQNVAVERPMQLATVPNSEIIKLELEEKDAVFLAKCLMSHLQMGCTLILTETPTMPNESNHRETLHQRWSFKPGTLSFRALRFLNQFLSADEHTCFPVSNNLSTSDQISNFCPGIALQTLVMDTKGFVCVNELLKSPRAPSVVDVTRRKVRQLARCSKETTNSTESCKDTFSWKETEENGEIPIHCGSRSQLKTVLSSETGPLITEFFDQLINDIDCEEISDSEGIRLFTRHLRLRGALAAKTLAQCQRLKAPGNEDKCWEPALAHQWLFGVGNSGLVSNNPKVSSKESDLRVTLGLAEKYHPGISKSVGPFNI